MPVTLAESPPDRARTDTPLRVLDITDFYSDTVSGGVKTYLHAKSAHLERLGVEHTLVVPGERDEIQALGATRVHRVRGWTLPMSRAYRVMLSVDRLRAILRAERPHIVEVGSPFLVPHLLARALRLHPVPTVGFYHADVVRTFAEPYVPSRWAAPLRVLARMSARRLVRRVYRRFDATVAASDSTAEDLGAMGISGVHTVGLGVQLETFRPYPQAERIDWRTHGVPDGVPVAFYAGRFCAEKRLDVILQGHALLPEEERPHLVLVGGGPHRKRHEELARRREGLTVLPYMDDRATLARHYASADFYLATGPGETFGLSIAEAMACGLPVVAVDRAAAPDRVAGSGVGVLYEHGRPVSAAAALRRMTRRIRDGQGEALRRQARRHAEAHFDWAGTFASLLDLYRSLLPVGRR